MPLAGLAGFLAARQQTTPTLAPLRTQAVRPALAALHSLPDDPKRCAAQGILSLSAGEDEALKAKLKLVLDDVASAAQFGGIFNEAGQETVASLLTFPSTTKRDALLVEAGETWLQNDWQAAIAWAGTMPEPQMQMFRT